MKSKINMMCNTVIIFFILIAFVSMFERNDFLGTVLDKNKVKNEMKSDEFFKKSLFTTDKSYARKFSKKRYPASTLLNFPELKKDMMKFEAVKSYKSIIKKELQKSEYILWIIALSSLIAGGILLSYKNLGVALALDIILFIEFVFYNLFFGKALSNLGIEDKVYFSWGVAQTLQLFIMVGIFIYLFFMPFFYYVKEYFDHAGLKNSLKRIKGVSQKHWVQIKKNRFAYGMLLPSIIIVVAIIVYPFLFNFRLSFSNLNLIRFPSFLKGDFLNFTGMQNYFSIFSDTLFWSVLLRTIIWTVTNVVCHVVGGVFLAIMLNRDMKMRPIYQVFLIVPWAIPQFIAVLVWKGMFNTSYGAINLILSKIVRIPIFNFMDKMPESVLRTMFLNTNEAGEIITMTIPWLSDPFWLFTGAIITNIWLGVPFMMMIALGGLQSIPSTYYEAADIDGASAIQQIWNITLPLLKPVMVPAIIMGTVWTFNNLTVIYLLSENALTGKVDILVSYVYKAAFNLYRYGYSAAFSAVIFAILMIFSIVMMRVSKAKEGVR